MKRFLLRGLLVILTFVAIFGLGACEEKGEDAEELDYPVAGLWHAHEEWLDPDPYNRYEGDHVALDVYFEFLEDGSLRNRLSTTLNGRLVSDTGWVIFNGTWSVNKNTITLSSGRQFVIVNDEFNDIYPNPRITLHFFKER